MGTSAYVERAKKEKDRNKLATDDGFWFCICFRTLDEQKQFQDLLGIPEGRYISGIDLRQATEKYKPAGKRRNMERKIPAFPGENPLLEVEHTGYLDEDCFNEAMAIYEAFVDAKPPERLRHASQSDIYICACFRSSDDVQEYQAEMRLGKFGSRYLDGSAWLRELMKHGEDTERAV